MDATAAPTRKQQQAARSRAALIAAASSLFAQRGYRDTSMQAIGEAAGISRGSISWHFGSKEGLLWAVVADAFDRWEHETLVPDVGDATGLEAVRRGIESHRRFVTEHGDAQRLFFVLLFEALGPRSELQPQFAALHEHLRDRCSGWISSGQAAGEIRTDLDARVVVTTLIGSLGGLAYQNLIDPGAIALDAAYAALVATYVQGLAATQ